jgi:hypothetical protein
MRARYTNKRGGAIAVWIQREERGPVEYLTIPRADRTLEIDDYSAESPLASRRLFGPTERRSGTADRRSDTTVGHDIAGRRDHGRGRGRRSTD